MLAASKELAPCCFDWMAGERLEWGQWAGLNYGGVAKPVYFKLNELMDILKRRFRGEPLVSRMDDPDAAEILGILQVQFPNVDCLLHEVNLNDKAALGLLKCLRKAFREAFNSECEVNWESLIQSFADIEDMVIKVARDRVNDIMKHLKAYDSSAFPLYRVDDYRMPRMWQTLKSHLPYLPSVNATTNWTTAQSGLQDFEKTHYPDHPLSSQAHWTSIASSFYHLHRLAARSDDSVEFYTVLKKLECWFPHSLPIGYRSDPYLPDIVMELIRHFFQVPIEIYIPIATRSVPDVEQLEQDFPDTFPYEGALDWEKLVRLLDAQHTKVERLKLPAYWFPSAVSNGKVDWKQIKETLEALGSDPAQETLTGGVWGVKEY